MHYDKTENKYISLSMKPTYGGRMATPIFNQIYGKYSWKLKKFRSMNCEEAVSETPLLKYTHQCISHDGICFFLIMWR